MGRNRERVGLDAFRGALECACGNVTHAGIILGISKVHAMRLAAKFDLRADAESMRVAVGGERTGRPFKH